MSQCRKSKGGPLVLKRFLWLEIPKKEGDTILKVENFFESQSVESNPQTFFFIEITKNLIGRTRFIYMNNLLFVEFHQNCDVRHANSHFDRFEKNTTKSYYSSRVFFHNA